MSGHGSSVSAVSGVSGSSSQDTVQAISQQQVLQDLQELLEILEGTKKSSDKEDQEKKIETIMQNIQHNIESNPAAFTVSETKHLEHLVKITTADIQQLSQYLDNLNQSQNNSDAIQMNLSPNASNQDNNSQSVQSVNLDTHQNASNYFDPHKYHEQLTSIIDQINNPAIY